MGVAAAVGTIATAITSGLAAAGGIAAVATAGLTLVAATGAALGVIGVVTHDKALSTAGMVLGLVGGVGALASSAIGGASSLFGVSDAPLADSGTAAVSAPGSAAANAGVDAGNWDVVDGFSQQADPAAAGALDASNAADTGAGGATLGVQPNAATGADLVTPPSPGTLGSAPPDDLNVMGTTSQDVTPAGGTAGAVPAQQAGPATSAPTAANVTQMPPSTVAPAAGGVNTAAPGAVNTGAAAAPQAADTGFDPFAGNTMGQAANTGQAPDTGASGVLGSIMNYSSAHPMLAMGAVTAGANLLSSATSPITPATASQLNASAANQTAQANLTNLQAANMAQPKAVATNTGIINQTGVV